MDCCATALSALHYVGQTFFDQKTWHLTRATLSKPSNPFGGSAMFGQKTIWPKAVRSTQFLNRLAKPMDCFIKSMLLSESTKHWVGRMSID